MRALAAALLLALPGTAQAAEPPCLSAQEFSAVTIYTLPAMVRGAAQRCEPVLPPKAFLRTSGEKLAQRYAKGRDRQWPHARQAVIKAGGSFDPQAGPLLGTLPEDTLKPMVDDLVIAVVDQRLPENRCKAVDRMLMLLSPLPAPVAAETIALTTGLAARTGEKRLGQLRICRA